MPVLSVVFFIIAILLFFASTFTATNPLRSLGLTSFALAEFLARGGLPA